jgi:hypothetical protein
VRLLLVLCVLAWPLVAGKRIITEGTDGKTTTRTEILLDGTRMRVNAGAVSTIVRKNGDSLEVLMLDTVKHEYYPLDRNYYETITAQLKKFKTSVPPDAAPVTRYERTGTERINGVECSLFVQFSGNQKVSELCMAKPSDLGVSAEEFRIAGQAAEQQFRMMEGFGDTAPGMEAMDLEATLMMNPELRGIPLRSVEFNMGTVMHREKLLSIKSVAFTNADFSLGKAVRVAPPLFGVR